MPFRLSTLFLIVFTVAIPLVIFGIWTIFINAIFLLAALLLNRVKTLALGILFLLLLIILSILLLLPAVSSCREAARRAQCMNNLKQIGLALHNYHDVHGHFPPAKICEKDGKPLFSWRVEILPMLGRRDLYDSLKKDEPWDSEHNSKILNQSLIEYICPSNIHNEGDFTTNYVAVIGPGTAWREDALVKLSDLPDGGSHTFIAVEVANSSMHWAEPRDITVEEALERMKTGQGLSISTPHPSVIYVLFADGAVWPLPAKMPISTWRKILAGEVTDLENIYGIDKSAADMVDVSVYNPPYEPDKWTILFGVIVWLISIVLLFRRAIKSRLKSASAT